ncbi:interleukin-13 receptor subunit alpha-1 [Engraulis encrasicolus]|uniref:interleukin-13 receptor subunit alpha-1 n=1 Tax=Engraulis encrasicolus TaxID=184585 RepID=UPI002FD3F26C
MVFLYWNISILLSFCCVFMSAPGDTESLPPPVNATLTWNKEFCPVIEWTRPNISDTCVVNYTVSKYRGSASPQPTKVRDPRYLSKCESREEDLTFEISTRPLQNCPGLKASSPIRIHYPRLPDVVKGFTCAYYASESLNCSWHPDDRHTNLRSYYSFSNNSSVTELRPCPHDQYEGSRLIGCHLRSSLVGPNHVYFLINASSDHTPIYSTYHRDIKYFYRPPPPVVSVSLVKANLNISWSPPNFRQLGCFHYQLHYNACGKHEVQTHEETSVTVPYDPKCQYSIRVKTFVPTCGGGESLPSQVQTYGPDSGDAVLVLVAVGVCVFLVLCALLVCFFYKYKEKLLPKIPEPRLDRSIRGLMERLYVPVSEDVEGNLEVCVDTRQPMLALSSDIRTHSASNTHSGHGNTHTGSGDTHTANSPQHTGSGNRHTANSPQHTGSGDTHTASSPHTGNSSDTHSHTSNSIDTGSGTTHTGNSIHTHIATETHTTSDTRTENNRHSASSTHTCNNTTHTDTSTAHTHNNTHTDRDTQDNSGTHTGANTNTDDKTHTVEESMVDMDYSSVTRR